MPMRTRFSNGSRSARASATTLVTIDPTVRQATRMSSVTADLEQWVASHDTWSSKARAWPAPWRAQGTWTTVGPCSGHCTLGASASR